VWESGFENGLEGFTHSFDNTSTARFDIVPDPSGRGKGNVYQGIITGQAASEDGKHRPYPGRSFPLLKGAFSTTFEIWLDPNVAPKSVEYPSFISVLSVFDRAEPIWNLSVMVDILGSAGRYRLALNQSEVFETRPVTLPTGQWVEVRVDVDRNGVTLYQDGRLVARGKLDGELRLEAAHWGLYALGVTQARLLNDNMKVWSYSGEE
jgi:hypothetical protein